MGSVDRNVTEATNVLTCRDLTHSSESQTAPLAGSSTTGDPGRRVAAVGAGAVLTVAAVAGLHGLYRASGDVAAWGVWVVLLLAGMTALSGGVKLIMWGAKPMIAAASKAGKQRLSEPLQAVIAAVGLIAGSLGVWWTLRGGYAIWWQHLTGESQWSLPLGVGQMLVAVLAGAGFFTGGGYLTGLAREALTDSGLLVERDRTTGKRRVQEGLWHPGLVAALIGGGLGLVLLTAGITPRLYVWITGPDVFPAVAAITLVLLWAIGSNLGWWKGLVGLWKWATDASQKATATAGVVAVLMFSASGLGLGWFSPATVPQARAACPPDCGGPGGSDGPPGGGQMFQPPSQGGPQMPDYQGGINQAPLDQNSGISIYNTQAPSVSNNGVNGSSGQQGAQQGWDQPAHGTQMPDYQNATPYTQGPGKPNPDFNGGQANPGSQGGQSNQGVQQPAQQPPQPPQQDARQQPNQSPDQQKIDDLTKQLQEKQQQSGQDRQRIDDLTKQLQQNKQQNGNQKLPKAPSKDKKKDDKEDEQQDRDEQSGTTDLASLLLGAGSTRRRKQDDQQQPDQQQEQGPDTQALAEDGAQLGQSLPGDIANTVSDSVNLGQSAGSAAQNFGSAAQAGASLASSAQSGAVNPMDAVALVQGVSGGISDTADAVSSGASIASTWINNAGQGAQLAADANPQLKPQAEQVQQLTQAGGQVADLTGQVAGGVSQVSGVVNTVSSLGASGMPDTSGATDALSGTATAVNGPGDVPEPPTPPTPQSSSVQALDSTTRAPQQPYHPTPQPSPPPSPSGTQANTEGQASIPKPLSPMAASAFPAPLQALNSANPASISTPHEQSLSQVEPGLGGLSSTVGRVYASPQAVEQQTQGLTQARAEVDRLEKLITADRVAKYTQGPDTGASLDQGQQWAKQLVDARKQLSQQYGAAQQMNEVLARAGRDPIPLDPLPPGVGNTTVPDPSSFYHDGQDTFGNEAVKGFLDRGADAVKDSARLSTMLPGTPQGIVRGVVDPEGLARDQQQLAEGVAPLVGAGGDGAPGVGDSWKNVGKDAVSWDEWAKHNYGRAAGQNAFDVLSVLVGGRGISEATRFPKAVPIEAAAKPVVENQKLQNIIDNLYKGVDNPSRVGDGTTMDALKFELDNPGSQVGGRSHLIKSQETVNGLNKLLNRGALSSSDTSVVNKILDRYKELGITPK
nr:hypothetical protein [Mycobacteroides chelonae]